MALVGAVKGELNKATNLIRNPLERNVVPVLDSDDFKDGLVIEEILPDGKKGDKVIMIGNLMPHIPLKYGGSQRLKKEFYSGYSEPTMQVFGPEEDDITINGEFKDKRYQDKTLKGVALEIQQQIDAIRIRGNIVRFRIGEMERYAIISKTDFELNRTTKIKYAITFSVIGFNKPKNAKFLQKNKEYPFAINNKLIAQATAFQSSYSSIPKSVPISIGDAIRNMISDVASLVASVTGFIDQIVASVEDIRKSIERAKGLVKHVQNKIRAYKRLVGGFNPFNTAQSLTGRYENAKFYSGIGSALSSITALLNSIRNKFSSLAGNLPLARHLTKEGDSLQKIAIKFYGSADNWKNIYDYNNLVSTQLETGRLLEIPRL
jgi:tetrahydromethanopterin S-methyltransferase subunit B